MDKKKKSNSNLLKGTFLSERDIRQVLNTLNVRIWGFEDFHDTTVGQTQQDEDTFFSKQ